MPEMKCPVCGKVLTRVEVYDGYFDEEKHEEEWYGTCSKCNKEYRWTAVYVFKDVVDFGEVKEEDIP